MLRPQFVAAVVLPVAVALAMPAEPSVVVPVSFDKLVRSADIVFTGTVVRVASFWMPNASGRTIVTRVTFRVERALKGDQQIEVLLEFLGGRVGDDALEIAGVPRFEVGQRDVIFALTDRARVSPIAGFNQGRFRVNRDPAGRQHVTTHDGWAFSSVAQLGRARSVVSAAPVATLTLEAFEREIIRVQREARR